MIPRTGEPSFIETLVEGKRVIVCCGAGGVGKTTTAAAIAIAGARAGRKALVLTVDPARRLAEALGLSPEHCDAPAKIPEARLRAAGIDGPGEVHAWMIEPTAIVDGLVRRLSENEAQVERILGNRLYQHFSKMVVGLQEYTAAEALHIATHDPAYDLVVLDTPPSRNALDFLDAPRKLAILLDEKVVNLFLPSVAGKRPGRVRRIVQKVFTMVFGVEFFQDLQLLVEALNHLFGEVRVHAEAVRAMLGSSEASFVLVTSADPSALAEAEFFRAKLVALSLPLSGYVLNRSFAFTRGLERPEQVTLPPGASPALREGLEKLALLADLEARLADRDRALLGTLRAKLGGGHALATPHLGDAIASLEGVARLAESLVDTEAKRRAS